MHWSFAACFGVVLLTLAAMQRAESGTCDKTNVCPAIKALENKLDKLIALVTPPGKFELTRLYCIFIITFLCFFLFFFLYQDHHMSLIFFTVAPAASCKELHDKHK